MPNWHQALLWTPGLRKNPSGQVEVPSPIQPHRCCQQRVGCLFGCNETHKTSSQPGKLETFWITRQGWRRKIHPNTYSATSSWRFCMKKATWHCCCWPTQGPSCHVLKNKHVPPQIADYSLRRMSLPGATDPAMIQHVAQKTLASSRLTEKNISDSGPSRECRILKRFWKFLWIETMAVRIVYAT